jgi:NitT/TauT family transport system substrate-binding protein
MSAYDDRSRAHGRGGARLRRLALALVATVGVTAACSSGGDAPSANAVRTVRLAVTASSLDTVLYAVAEHENTFAKHHIQVLLTKLQSGQEDIAMQQLIQGAVDFTLTAAADPIAADSSFAAEGGSTPLRIVAAGGSTTSVVLASKIDYTGLASLRGLRLAVTDPTANHRIQFEWYLNQHGTSAAKLGITFVTVSPADLPTALADGRIDGFVHAEPTTSLVVQQDHARLAFNITGAAQQAASQALTVGTSYLKSHRQTVQDVVDALRDASKDYATMSEATVVGIYSTWLGADSGLMASVYHSEAVDPRMTPLRQAANAFWTADRPAMVQEGTLDPKATQRDLFDYSFSR